MIPALKVGMGWVGLGWSKRGLRLGMVYPSIPRYTHQITAYDYS
jgi:hypothetical protein